MNGFLPKVKIDYIAIPYALNKRDVSQVKDLLGYDGAHVQVLAKIDTVESIHHFEEIIKAADGIIINRNDLSLEM